MANNNRNEYASQNITNNENLNRVMQQLKEEIAAEFGFHNYENMDKGNLTSRQNGTVGGIMTKRLISFAQHVLSQGDVSTNVQTFIQVTSDNNEIPSDLIKNTVAYNQQVPNNQYLQ